MIQKSKSVSPMSNEGRNAYVIEHINEALWGLLKEKSLNEISISEICETAVSEECLFTAITKAKKM